MIPELIVKIILAETRDAIGTGYAIHHGVILTAWHVIEGIDLNTLELEWVAVTDESGAVCKSDVGGLAAEQWSDYDVVALSCDFPQAVNEHFKPATLANKIPNHEGARWFSVGFPLLNGFEKKDAGGLWGTDLNGEQIRLNLDNTYIDSLKLPEGIESGWAGMSGAPVFCAKSKALAAVVIEHDKLMDKEVYGASLPKLLKEDEVFLATLGLVSQNQQFFQSRCDDLLEEIKGSHVCDAFIKLFSDEGEQVSTNLLVDLQEDPIGCLEKIRLAVQPAIKQEPDEQENARRLFFLVLGLHVAEHVSSSVTNLHQLAAKTRAVVEIELAASYQLPPDLENKVRDQVSEIAGRYAIEDECFSEVGWEPQANADMLTNVVEAATRKAHKKTFGYGSSQPLDDVAREDLNETLATRRKGDAPQLIRFEVKMRGEDDDSHPLMNDAVCELLHSDEYLPDLPIVRFGLEKADNEGKLRAQIREFLRMLEDNEQ